MSFEPFPDIPLSMPPVMEWSPPIETGLMYESRSIWVPDGKTHVAREIMNKI